MAKEYFSARGISYVNLDVSADKAAADEIVRVSGQMGVPVIVIDGKVVVGFDKARIEELLS